MIAAVARIKAEPVPILGLSDEGLLRCSKERLLSMSLEEMKAVQRYFREAGREPTDVELETLAQTWSEHCKHKTFKGIIDYTERRADGVTHKIYDDLLKQTIVKATKDLDRKFCLSVFEDNAGIIEFDRAWGIAFKVETHNHPSALEPYGGAGTGIGGVIRDILGVGLGAKPILNTDAFCVGEFGQDLSRDSGMLRPERVLSGVIAGVRDYGNRMGIPTVNGAVLFHKGYTANPIVFCGTAGLIPKDKILKNVSPGDLIVAVGGRTGRDGIHGATFSSLALEAGISASVVQIGNAITEKKAADAILRARDLGLYNAITDCGAGGFSRAVGEMAADCGAKVRLEKAPLKYPGLLPWEIWVSESQERMVLSVPGKNLKELQEICAVEDAECSVIGEFAATGRLEVFHDGERVCDLDLGFLHDGIPRKHLTAVWSEKRAEEDAPGPVHPGDLTATLKKLLAHPDIGSKKWVVKQYDHEVQGGSVIKPFSGPGQKGPSDAAVCLPVLGSWKGVGVSSGINPLFGEIDPYWMAANAIDEALRNLSAVGGDVEHAAILDNFCWGNVLDEEVLGALVRCSQGCHDFAKAYGTPFISGKDSLNNTWRNSEGKISSIPGTLLISAVGVIEDARKCLTPDLKKPGNLLALLGETKNEMGGSHWNAVSGSTGGQVPKVDAAVSLDCMKKLHQAARKGLLRSCHDLSEGGLAVALAEMAMGGGLGASIKIPEKFTPAVELFGESASRWVIEFEPSKISRIKKIFSGLPFTLLGKVQKAKKLEIGGKKKRVSIGLADIEKSWSSFSDRQ